MGLINAAWGGSRIEAWTSARCVARQRPVRRRTGCAGAVRQRSGRRDRRAGANSGAGGGAARTGACRRRRAVERVLSAGDAMAQRAARARRMGTLGRARAGRLQRHALVSHHGAADRSSRRRRHAVLELGSIDETDMTWVNGRGGRQHLWRRDPAAQYALPRGPAARGREHRRHQRAGHLSRRRHGRSRIRVSPALRRMVPSVPLEADGNIASRRRRLATARAVADGGRPVHACTTA